MSKSRYLGMCCQLTQCCLAREQRLFTVDWPVGKDIHLLTGMNTV